jgi:hypothetical protein
MSENIIASAEERAAIERWEGEGGRILAVDSLRDPLSDFHRSLPEDAALPDITTGSATGERRVYLAPPPFSWSFART